MKFRLVQVKENNAYMNMGIDEAIMESVRGGGVPTIRFYTWKPSAISIGFFQGLKNEVDLEACKKAKVDVVRRLTGGGAVFHDKEITYSLIAPVDLFPHDVVKSYKIICGYIVKTLEEIGIIGQFSPINDVIVNGKKISGSAQTRKNGVLLQHGTLLYEVDVDKMFSLLRVGKEKIADKLIKSVKKRVTCVRNFGDISFDSVCKSMENAFSEGNEIEIGDYSEKELRRAKELADKKYSRMEWIGMR